MPIAQLVELPAHNWAVLGSNPSRHIMIQENIKIKEDIRLIDHVVLIDYLIYYSKMSAILESNAQIEESRYYAREQRKCELELYRRLPKV